MERAANACKSLCVFYRPELSSSRSLSCPKILMLTTVKPELENLLSLTRQNALILVPLFMHVTRFRGLRT